MTAVWDVAAAAGVAESWSSLGLSDAVATFDKWATEMREREGSGKAARAKLVELDTAFLAAPEGVDRLPLAAQLQAAFKSEVDTLTRRARAAERAYMKVLDLLHAAPDPTAYLAQAVAAMNTVAALTAEMEVQRGEVCRLQSRLVEVEGDNARLSKENGHLDAELTKLSNQDITIRQLEQRLTEFEKTVEDTVAMRLLTQEAELRRVFDSELEGLREMEAAMEARVATLQLQLAAANASRDEAQAALYNMSRRMGGGGAQKEGGSGGGDDGGGGGGEGGASVSSLQSQVSMLNEEVANLRSQVMAREMEVANLSAKLAQAYLVATPATGTGSDPSNLSSASSPGVTPASGVPPLSGDPFGALRAQAEAYRARVEAVEAEMAAGQATIVALQHECAGWRSTVEGQRTQFERSLSETAARLSARDMEVASLKQALAQRPTTQEVAALRQQVAVLHMVTATGSADASVVPPGSTSGGDVDGEAGTGEIVDVQAALVQRCRQLEARAASAEVEVRRLKTEATEREAAHAALTAQLAQQEATINRLEDLVTSGSGEGGGRSGPAYPPPPTSTSATGGGPPASALSGPEQLRLLLSDVPPSSTPSTASSSTAAAAAPASTSGAGDLQYTVDILKGQRDRVRAKLTEVETALMHKAQAVADLEARSTKLTADNVKLYEKIRYLQTLLSGDGGRAASSGGGGESVRIRVGGGGGGGMVPSSSVEGGGEDEVERTYRKLYNDVHDPFADFTKREKVRQVERLSATDKITLTSSRILLGNKPARTFVFFYALILHILVFVTLWHFTHVTHGDCEDHRDPGAGNSDPFSRLVPPALRGNPTP